MSLKSTLCGISNKSTTSAKAPYLRWKKILPVAKEIVESYDTGVTLRQLFYQLVSKQILPNTISAYVRLSRFTAEARRKGNFPEFLENGRNIQRTVSWDSASSALTTLAYRYRRDRTEGQKYSIYLGIEKRGLVPQLEKWFGDLGIPVLALGGYSSHTFANTVREEVKADGRPAILIYGGDFDASGQDIYRDFKAKTDCWCQTIQVALSKEQVELYDLPENNGKDTDSRAAGFVRRHGANIQVEIDALDPNTLRSLFQTALSGFWDIGAHQASLERENLERKSLWDHQQRAEEEERLAV